MGAEGVSAGLLWRRVDDGRRARRDATGDVMVWVWARARVRAAERCRVAEAEAEAVAGGWDAADDLGRAGDARRRAYWWWWWSGQQGCVVLLGVGGGDGDGDMVTPIGDSKTKRRRTAAVEVTA